MKIEWKGRQAFVEIAESLGIGTDEVMAVRVIPDGKGFLVLYTVNTDTPDAIVWEALLGRDDDGILRREKHRGLMPLNEFMARVEAELND